MPRTPRFIALLLSPLLLALFGPTPIAAAPTSITLHWTAPGDDGVVGRATRYEMRYSTRVIMGPTFNTFKYATGLPTPKAPGGLEQYTLTGLAPDSTYVIAMKTVDEAGNWSAISNIVVRPSGILGVEGDAMFVGFSEPWPNPASRSVQLKFGQSRAGQTQARVFDLAGRSVRLLDQGWHAAGTVPIAWDLRDEQGRRVSPGAYIILANGLGRQWTRRVIVID